MSDFKTTEIAETILPLLDGVKQTGDQQWIARCPVHDDSRASLSISAGDDGRVLFHCHAGCSTEQIVSKLGLSMSDLFPKNINCGSSASLPPHPGFIRAAAASRLPLF